MMNGKKYKSKRNKHNGKTKNKHNKMHKLNTDYDMEWHRTIFMAKYLMLQISKYNMIM